MNEKQPRLRGRRVHDRRYRIGISSNEYDINLALTIIRSEPSLTILRIVEKPNETIVELGGRRQDVTQFRATYNTRLMEKLSRLYPDMTYDEKKSKMV